jgi:FecR protein
MNFFAGVQDMMRITFLACFALLTIYAGHGFAAAIGKVVAIQGAPSASGPSGTRGLAAGSEVFEHDKITVASGNAQILMVDGTRLVVGPGSALVVEKFLLRGRNSVQDLSVNALRGTFRFITGRGPKSAYRIRTANATVGIRGTGFDFWVKGNTGVAVHEGQVRLCNRSKNCVDLNAVCDLGIATSASSQKVIGQTKLNTIQNRLPYINNQGSLNSLFRLNVSACRAIEYPDVGQGHNTPTEPPPPRCTGRQC